MNFKKVLIILTTIVIIFLIVAVSFFIYDGWYANKRTVQKTNMEPMVAVDKSSKEISSIIKLFDNIQNENNIHSYKVNVINGINQNSGTEQPDSIKEMLRFEYNKDSYINVNVISFNSSKDAKNFYDMDKMYYEKRSEVCNFHEDSNINYFMTYIIRSRNDFGIIKASLSDDFLSHLDIQKSNLVIQIFEKSHSYKISNKDEVIELLAQKISGIK